MRRSDLDSIAARVFAMLLAGIAAAAALAFAISTLQARATVATDRELRLVDRIADAAAVISASPLNQRPDVLGVGPEALRLGDAEPAKVSARDAALSERVDQRLGSLAVADVSLPLADPCPAAAGPGPPTPPPPLPGPAVDLKPPPPAPPPPPGPTGCRLVRFTFPDGQRLSLVAPLGPPPPSPILPLGPAPLIAVALVAGGLAWAVTRFTMAPLTRLAAAAEALGEDIDRPPLTLGGPREVRQAAKAFNAMQSRLRQAMEERTYMLAAITHDLQTPLTRQRLRLEKIAEPGLREQLLADQDAMRVLIREGLDLARASHDGEDVVALEIDSLLDSLVADAVAAGQNAKVIAQCGRTVRARPQAVARCLANLLDNALKYAGAAELSAERSPGGVLVRVLDRGPGLRDLDPERLFEPFRRGETSRSRETGGAGLGLTIARLLAERSGARLTLHDRIGGGLEARLLLERNWTESIHTQASC